MIGATLTRNGRVYNSVCGGDSGGPLSYYNSRQRKHILIGKLYHQISTIINSLVKELSMVKDTTVLIIECTTQMEQVT